MTKNNSNTNTLDRIIEVAESLFANQGYDGTSTRQIASGAGISIQTLHYHCKNKENLFNIVLERAIKPVLAMVDIRVQDMLKKDLDDDQVLKEEVDQVIEDLFDVLSENSNYPLLFFRQLIERNKKLKRTEFEEILPALGNWNSLIDQMLGDKRKRGIDFPLFLVSLSWIYWGLFVNPEYLSGVLGIPPDSPEYNLRLKAHAKEMTARMLGLSSLNGR